MASTTSYPCFLGEVNLKWLSRARWNHSGSFSKIPMVRSPWTFEWPRTGQRPAPGRPMAPMRRWTFTISRMISTAFFCWVIPMAQQVMSFLSLSRTVSVRVSISRRVRPESLRIRSHDVVLTADL